MEMNDGLLRIAGDAPTSQEDQPSGAFDDELPTRLELPTDARRATRELYRAASAPVVLDRNLVGRLRAVSRQHDVVAQVVLLATWAAVVGRLAGQSEIVIAVPTPQRWQPRTIGLASALHEYAPAHIALDDDLRVDDLLLHVQQGLFEAQAKDISLADISSAAAPNAPPERGSQPRSPVQVAFALHPRPHDTEEMSRPASSEPGPSPVTLFELSLLLHESDDTIAGELIYADELFEADTIRRWIGYFESALDCVVRQPDQPVGEIVLMGDEERRQVIEAFNATRAAYPHAKLIHEIFEEQAARDPQAVAVICGKERLTYEQLNGKANQLARLLVARSVGPDRLVALCVERSVEMMVGLLAIFKAGGAYVPLDPDYPPERLEYMLADAAAAVVLISERTRHRLPANTTPTVTIDGDGGAMAAYSSDNLRRTDLRSNHLAYVIYTSGSTGQPKGVMIEHRNVISLWQALEHIYRHHPCRRIALNASINFDASVKQLVQLLSGRTLILVPQEYRWNAAALLDWVGEQQIEGIDCTPWQLRSWISAGLLQIEHTPLRLVLVGGESIDEQMWHALARCPAIAFYNVYGPTESTVDATFARIDTDRRGPHIGAPMENRSVYILDRTGTPLPIGVAGEIHIGGAGVARGYLNRDALMRQRFIPDPFSDAPRARLYRTGDLGRWRRNGTIEYLGRNDEQLKIRGFRVELGEIEARLERCHGVRDAVVLAREDAVGERRLVAYVVAADRPAEANALQLHAQLKQLLPDYMIPSAFVTLDRMPLTANGKLNRKALPAPDAAAYVSRPYETPQGRVEELLAAIWQALLRVERIGRRDNFFELGGHSLLVMEMLEQLRHAGLTVDVARVFDAPVLCELAAALTAISEQQINLPPNLIPPGCQRITPQMLTMLQLTQDEIDLIAQAVPGGTRNIQDIYPLAPLQEGTLFHHLLNDEGGDTYIVTTILSLASQRRLEELIAALQAVIDRHDVLRTAVLWERLPQPVQVVYRHAQLPVETVVLATGRDALDQIREIVAPSQQRLDLRRAPLMRLLIAGDPGNSGQWYAVLQRHHLSSDHVTFEFMIEEVVATLDGTADRLPQAVPFRNHVARAIAHARTRDAAEFFRRKLADVVEPTAPFRLLDVYGDGSDIVECAEELDPQLVGRIRTSARRMSVSAATLFHAAWALVAAGTSGRDDVVFGSVLLGRLQAAPEGQRILGMFINTLPLRLQLHAITARQLVQQTQRELVELLAHEQAPLATAQRCSGIAGSAPLFSSLLNYVHNVPNPAAEWSSARGVQLLANQERTNYPLTVGIDDFGGERVRLTVQADRRVSARSVLDYVRTAIRSLVEALECASQQAALALSIMPDSERARVVGQFNDTLAAFPDTKLIHELFEEQVDRTPRAVALAYEGHSLTYEELNVRANQLAAYLRAQGVGPERLVAICTERSFEMVIGLLGILKAGGAYVPLDPDYPAERLAYMLEDSQPAVLLTQQHLLERLPPSRAEVIALDLRWSEIARYPSDNLHSSALGLRPDHLAYVIYTSGSTGKPKGAMNEHRAVVNRLHWMQTEYQLGAADSVLQKTPFSFDVSVWEFFWTLLYGARLVIARPRGHQDPDYLLQVVEEAAVTRMHFVPSMLQIFLDRHRPGRCPTLRHVVCSGEELPASLERKFFASLPHARLSNLYGPTEAAVDVTSWECAAQERSVRVPIGRPIANTQMYVLNRFGQPVPIGVAGELHIGGVGVGRGYLNRPELTAERFVPDPFSRESGARMYRTGDLARWRSDGALEYLGRDDYQVKIRGLRIELGEIEALLTQHELVSEAVVVARQDGGSEKRLVAYVTAAGATAPSADILRAYAKDSLPEYMVPSAFVVLEGLPLSPNGKLDRGALPVPDLDAYVTQRYEAPRGELEQSVAQIWQTLLQVERVGRYDNLFDLGGHSLLAMQFASRLDTSLLIRMPIRLLFELPTLAQLCPRLEELRRVQMLEHLADRVAHSDELLEKILAMPEFEVQGLLRTLTEEGRL